MEHPAGIESLNETATLNEKLPVPTHTVVVS